MATYKTVYVLPATQEDLKLLASRDSRPPWKIVAEALAYYRHVHKVPREAPANPTRLGRPPKAKPAL